MDAPAVFSSFMVPARALSVIAAAAVMARMGAAVIVTITTTVTRCRVRSVVFA